MTANEIVELLTKNIRFEGRTCDTIKAGNPEKEVCKIAVAMFATVETIKKAKAMGADMLIVHEPLYYHHFDEDTGSLIAKMKREIVENSGLVIFRYHDYAHAENREDDLIIDGGLAALGISGKLQRLYPAMFSFTPDKPVTARELVDIMSDKMGLHSVRLAGDADYPADKIALCYGTPPCLDMVIEDNEHEIILTGEVCEWATAEKIRDAYQMGMHKALIVMTHEGSERDGMKLFVKRFSALFPQIETEYIECGEVYI